MKIEAIAEASVADKRLAEEIANQKRACHDSEDPELNYMVHFSSKDYKGTYEA